MVAYMSTDPYKDASDETVYQEEQKALKQDWIAAGKDPAKFVGTKRWWTPGKTTFANQRQPVAAKPSVSPYGYESAMVPATEDAGIFEALRMGSGRTMEEIRAQRRQDAETAALRSGGGGGGRSYAPRPTSTTQTTQTTYEGTKPEIDLPEYDKAKIKEYRQKIAGPAMRRLRSEMRRALSASYENPNVRRHILRGALEGYGIGLGSITAESERAAGQRYGQEYGQQYQRALQTYQAAMQGYMLTAKQVTTGTTAYEGGGTGYETMTPREKEQAYREEQLKSNWRFR
jgi:hypothetical protein